MMKDYNEKLIPCEIYTLTLTHEFMTEDGERCVLDEPIKVNYTMMSNTGYTAVPFGMVLNELGERMAHYILQRKPELYKGEQE